jgi:hypothetical protein
MYSSPTETHMLGCHLEERGSGIVASQSVRVSYSNGLDRKSDSFARKERENEWYWLVDCKSKSLKATFEVGEGSTG